MLIDGEDDYIQAFERLNYLLRLDKVTALQAKEIEILEESLTKYENKTKPEESTLLKLYLFIKNLIRILK